MEPADVVLRFLDSLGRSEEAAFYLALFRAEAKERFAAIAVDASIARSASEAVVLDLKFLAALGLTPVVTLGLLEPGGAGEQAAVLYRQLGAAGVPATVITAGAPAATAAEAAGAARAGTIPILPIPGAWGAGPDERFNRLGALLTALATRKLIFLARRGGLRVGGRQVSIVNLTADYDALAASRELTGKHRVVLAQSRRLVLELVPHRLSIAITSPLDLLRELFTVKGAGTLLRRGAVILRRRGFEGVDRERLRALLAASFGRPPDDAFFTRPASSVYLEEGFRGAAILVDTPLGGYLSKFAVEREAQGEGIGRDLWDALAADHPVVFWRARPNNPISAWYAKLCDGLVRLSEWHVYWKGLAPRRIPDAVAHALAQPIDIPPA